MKKVFLLLPLCLLLGSANLIAQKKADTKKELPKLVVNDPLKARIHVLNNGLTVYMSVYKNAPRIQTCIAVKAGSKNDPADATGLAHYLEHMLFKGTDKYGTKDFAKEEPLLNKIEALYETYRKTSDPERRKIIYHQIDSISGVASTFAIANEYDKMTAAMGCTGTNAFTSHEQTVYINDIPSNQLENWLNMEAERFRKPVLRIFHTELEAVYEEKNRSLDSDDDKVFEVLMENLFKKHNYGQQTTIGTIEHLKNPSLTEIKKYYDKNYVPNNMAIVLSGDFDPDKALKMIEEKFSYLTPKTVEPYKFQAEPPITQPVVKEVFGPKAENLMMAYRFNGNNSADADMIKLIALILNNNKAGLMDANLNQKQKVLASGCFDYALNDYSILGFYGQAKEGQKLEEVAQLIQEQIDLLKKGAFEDWLLSAIITDLKYTETKKLENNMSRAMDMVGAFTSGQDWNYHIQQIERLSKITKNQIIEFAQKNMTNNYVLVYKRTGEDKSIQKVEKPQITPVSVNRDDQSPFLKQVFNYKPTPIEPVFIDLEKDIQKMQLKSGIPVLYTENNENQTFEMFYILDIGGNHDPILPFAISYLEYLGTAAYSPAKIKEEFYKLGCNYNVFSSGDQVYVSLNGLSENFEKSLALFETLINEPVAEVEAWDNLVQDILKYRADNKLEKGIILRQAMYNYGVYGPINPYTNIVSEEDLKKIKPRDLIAKIKTITSYPHRVLYYGTAKPELLVSILDKHHKVPAKLLDLPLEKQFKELETTNQVYVVDYDMKQAEIIMLSKGGTFDRLIAPYITIYNEYFGGGMSGIVFQELRESRALAYSVNSNYRTPSKKDKPYYLFAYIGTQADKLPEAMAGLSDLINNMPEAENQFKSAKDAVLANIRTNRITKSQKLFFYEQCKKLGLTEDNRKYVFDTISKLTLNDVKTFQEKYVKGKPLTVLVLGKKENLDLKALEKYGNVSFLTLKDVFGY